MKEERESYHHSTTRPIRGELEVGPDISMTTGEEWCRHLVRCWKPGSVRRSDRATSSLTVRWTANPSDRCGHRTNRAEDHGEAWTDELDRDGRTTRQRDGRLRHGWLVAVPPPHESAWNRGRGESMGGMQSPRRKKLGVVDGGRAKATFAREIKV